MENNLLFVYRDTAVVEEFVERMHQFDFAIDYAENGQQAMGFIKKHEYKVVVTGTKLDVIDGLKLIEYINQNYPKTVCIVLTRHLDLARFKFLVNQRDVFRIFLRPANYVGDFYQSVQEGFEFYDMQEMEQNERKRAQEQQTEYQDMVASLKKLTDRKNENIRIMGQFLLPLIKLSVNKFTHHLDQYQREQVILYEQRILSYYLKENYHPCQSLENMKAYLQEEFDQPGQERSLEVITKACPQEATRMFFQELRFVSWLLLKRYALFLKRFRAKVQVAFPDSGRATVSVELVLPPGSREKYTEQPFSLLLTQLTQNIVKEIIGALTSTTEGDTISYEMEMKTDKIYHFMEQELSIWTE